MRCCHSPEHPATALSGIALPLSLREIQLLVTQTQFIGGTGDPLVCLIFCPYSLRHRKGAKVFPVTVGCSSSNGSAEKESESSSRLTRQIDESASTGENKNVATAMWACGAAGSALPWHGRGHRFDPDQVHQLTPSNSDTYLIKSPSRKFRLPRNCRASAPS
jgi:hypothetical protein